MTLQAPLFSMGIDIASSGKADDVVDVAPATEHHLRFIVGDYTYASAHTPPDDWAF